MAATMLIELTTDDRIALAFAIRARGEWCQKMLLQDPQNAGHWQRQYNRAQDLWARLQLDPNAVAGPS